MSASTQRRLPYTAGLDGLRALAVAAVFLYHANAGWMPGGFLGVDLFFVLSGYLITSLLLNEWSAHGSIALKSFWTRRARRLFPAVAVVILLALLATLTIARDDLGRTRADALSALVYLTNWHEIVASHSYFNQFGRPSLLQHLWSLAVEEQFYLLWPLLLIAGLRWLRRGATVALTALLAAGSCALMWLTYSAAGDPSRVYYGTDTRVFTLLIGVLLAFAWPLGKGAIRRWRHSPAIADVVGLAALVGVLALFVRVRDFDPWLYHGGFLLMAIVGAVLVAAVSQPGTILGRVLGCGTLRWLGTRSYGIYLWHWPIMELTRPYVDVPLHGAPLVLVQAALTVGAAALSYRYVEVPIRVGATQKRLKGWLDRRRPRERLAWVSGSACALVTAAGLGFGLPAPTAAAFSSTATPSALRALSARPTASVVSPLAGSRPALHTVSAPGGSGVSAPGGSGRDGRAAGGRPPAPASGPVLALGDSVMLGCAPNLEQRIGHRLVVDAVVGRQAAQTIDRLAQYRASGRLPSTVIVQIGDNGPVWYADMQHLRRVLKGVPRVVLVNVRLARSWQSEVNSELKTYAQHWPQAVIANWFDHSSQAMLTDGVHPSIADRSVYANVVFDALKQAEHTSRR
jgi:peptidoglycan/LPS O-acetylase OafA/YrhL